MYLNTFYVLQHGVAISAVTTTSRNETLETNLAKASSIELKLKWNLFEGATVPVCTPSAKEDKVPLK